MPVEIIYDWGEGDIPAHLRHSAILESDVCLMYQSVSEFRKELMRQSRTLKPMYDHDGVMRWPVTFITDTDDDLFNVQPLNMTFGRYGITNPATGKALQDGDEIGVAHPMEIAEPAVQLALNVNHPAPLPGSRGEHEGERYIFAKDGKWHVYFTLWKDGQNFDIKANKERIGLWRAIMEQSNLVTCSTPIVEQYVNREAPGVPTFVTPNAIDFEAYPDIELREHPGEVRIMWQGSATHHEDLWPLNESIRRVAAKYPQAKWIFWGAPYKWARKNIPNAEQIEWCNYEAYKMRLSTIGHDINLCPLVDNIFNRCRSAIKWYESSAICRPAATLAQRTGAYAAEIQEGETGLLFKDTDEFETKLGALIEQETLRKTLASNAKDWMKTNRDAREVCSRLFQKYVEVREGHKLSNPPPKDPDSATELERVVSNKA